MKQPIYFLNSIWIIILGLNSCSSIDYKYIRDRWWSYESGYRLGKGDFLVFDDSTEIDIKGDTLFIKGNSTTIITKLDKKHNLLYMEYIGTDSPSVYYSHDFIKP